MLKSMTTPDLAAGVLSSADLRPRTKDIYQRAVRSFVDFADGAWDTATVTAWRDSLAGAGLKPQTVNMQLTGLKFATRTWAQRTGQPDFAAPVAQLRADPPPPRKALSLEEGRALVAACEGSRPIDLRDAALAVLGLRTGMRRSSICAMTFAGLRAPSARDSARAVAAIARVPLKGGHIYPVPLDDETVRALDPWIKWLEGRRQKRGAVFRSLSKPHVTGTVQINDQLQSDGLYKALRRRAKRAGIKNFHPQIFRLSFVSWCRKAGVADSQIAAVLGQIPAGGQIDRSAQVASAAIPSIYPY